MAARRLVLSAMRRRIPADLASLVRFSTTASTQPLPPTPPYPSRPQPPLESSPPPPPPPGAAWEEKGEQTREGFRRRKSVKTDYAEEQARVLRAALPHVLRLGWSESALIQGARDVGISPSIIGSLPRKEAALVEFFMDECLQKLMDKIDSGDELKDSILSERLSKLIRIRLEMQAPFISKWPQALSIQAQPMNLPTSFRQRAELVDEICHAAGDQGTDIDWYAKRTVLGGIYSTTEIYMLTDNSPEFRDTWAFLDHRVRDAFELQKTVQEATYLAEAVGAGLGSSMQGFMKRVFQG